VKKATKKAVIQYLREYLPTVMFGDGLEDDYIMNGIDFKGLDNMTDEELLKELAINADEDMSDDDQSYALLKRACKDRNGENWELSLKSWIQKAGE